MENLTYKSRLYKIRLVKTERDFFGNPVSSQEWDRIAEALEADVNQQSVFNFVHPKDSTLVYGRRYMGCPVNGNALMAVGKLRRTLDLAIVRIVLHSVMYKDPYLVLENYSPAFRNPELLADMVVRAFNSSLRKYGLEVMLEPWESKKPVYFLKDSWISYLDQLKKNPEIGERCMGFEQAMENDKQLKEELAKREIKKKTQKRHIKSDRIEDYTIRGNKEMIIGKLHELIDERTAPCEIAIPIRYLCDIKVFYDNEEYRLPFKAFIKEFETVRGHISESTYNDWISRNNQNPVYKHRYKSMEKIFTQLV